MKTYHICNVILGFVFSIAFFFQFIGLETFSLLVSSHFITQFCLYLDKNKITSENKIKMYLGIGLAIFFFVFLLWVTFIHNIEKKGFGPIVIEENQSDIFDQKIEKEGR